MIMHYRKTELKLFIFKTLQWSILFLTICISQYGFAQKMVVESLIGPVTAKEIQSFKDYIKTIPLDKRNQDPSNKYAYKLQGGAMEALGDMHDITGDKEILDRMILFSDAILSGRNDNVNGEKTVMYGNKVMPVWPNTTGGTCWAGELGDILAHISYTAIRIFKTPSIANQIVPDGNPYGFGKTYRERALRYVKEVDYSIDQAILPFIIQSNQEQRFPNGFCYKTNERVPWNQQSMFNGAFQRQAEVHELLGDEPSRVAKYDNIVKLSIQLLLSSTPAGAVNPVKASNGADCYVWAYNVDKGGVEDAGHAAYDILGVYRAWIRGKAGVTENQVKIFANTLMYRMNTSGNIFTEKVDGSGVATTLEAEWLYLSQVFPEVFATVAANMKNKLPNDPRKFGRLMYCKHKRYIGWNSGVNKVPAVSISSPSNNESFTTPALITINVAANDSDGTISKVEFFNGLTKLGEDTSSPYSFSWNNVTTGAYSITAKATDNVGAVTISDLVEVKVNAPANKVPIVNITSPSSNATFIIPASVTINANASDSDGSISKVEFYNGISLLGSDNSAPYSFVWNKVEVGTYNITAKAIDNNNTVAISAVVSISVKEPVNTCSGVVQYVENGNYIAGSRVNNAGEIYQCKPYPYTGWCNGSAWAYAPGTGIYWGDAWDKVGSCNIKLGIVNEISNTAIVSIIPNPTSQFANIKLNVEEVYFAEFSLINSLGMVVLSGSMNGNLEKRIDISGMQSGIYTIHIRADNNLWMNKIVKQ